MKMTEVFIQSNWILCSKKMKNKIQYDFWANLKLAHYGGFWISALTHRNRKTDEIVSYYQIQSKHSAFWCKLAK